MREELIERYKEMSEDFEPVEKRKDLCLRVNTLKINENELVERLSKRGVEMEKIEFLDNGYYYESKEFNLTSSQEYLQGLVYIQDPASQLPVQALDVKPGETILDACAAPGSKTTQIGAMMKNEGVLVATDNVLGRITVLKNNLERCGINNCIVYKKDAKLTNDLGVEFDKILVDAPCSGNYTQEEHWDREVLDFKANGRIQKEILKSALKVLKKGGELVYSTCSLEPEENEIVIQWVLDKFDVELIDTKLKVGSEGLTNVFGKELDKSLKKCVRIWPHKTGMQGFFIAKLKKK